MHTPGKGSGGFTGTAWLTGDGLGLYALLTVSFLLHLLADGPNSRLYLEIQNQNAFHVWQMFSGHLTHLSWEHFIGNAIGIALLQQVYGHSFKAVSWLWVVAGLMLFISSGLMLLSVKLIWYGGLSGLIVGLTSYAALIDQRHHTRFNTLVISALVIYSSFLCFRGEIVAGLGAVPVASLSHLLGVIGGITIALGVKLSHNRNKSRL